MHTVYPMNRMAHSKLIWTLLVIANFANLLNGEEVTCPIVEGESEGNVLLAHESDCTKFYQCSFGEKILHSCPEGLHFNSISKQCDWPDNAKCNLTNDDETIHEKDVPTECPQVEVNPEEDILIPHETDCGKFYKCNYGEKVVIDCPDGLYYNPPMRWCDWPRNVACSNDNSTNTCPMVEENPEIDILLPHEYDCTKFYKCDLGKKVLFNCTHGLHFSVKAQKCEWPELADCKHNNNSTNGCPQVEVNPEDDVLLPHEWDCTKFYKCNFGEKVVQDCPDDLHYNPEKRYCDWPADANCETKQLSESIESDSNVIMTYESDIGETSCPQVEEDPQEDILLPHENDCGKFYKCSLGNKIVQDCQEGLHFNPETNKCDWPENAKCVQVWNYWYQTYKNNLVKSEESRG